MRATAALITALLAVSFVGSANAQTRTNPRERLAAMQAENPTTYNECHALAVQRGYNVGDDYGETMSLMHFISGCIMGQKL
jgi:hypothetical protein